MAIQRCPHCQLPMTDIEFASGLCPACRRSLRAEPQLAAPVPPRNFLWQAISGLLSTVVIGLLTWIIIHRPEPRIEEPRVEPAPTVVVPQPEPPRPEPSVDREEIARAEKTLAELALAQEKAAEEQKLAEAKAREARMLLDRLNQEQVLAEKRIAEARAAEKVLVAAKAAVQNAQADDFDLRLLDDPARDFTLEDLKVPARIRIVGKVRSLRLGKIEGGAVLDLAQIQAAEITFTEAIQGKAKVTLEGSAGTLTAFGIQGQATFDASRLDAKSIVMHKAIAGQANARFRSSGASVLFDAAICERARVDIDAPAAVVKFQAPNGTVMDNSRLKVLARDIDFAGKVAGDSHVVATLSKGGSLDCAAVGGTARLLWQRQDQGDPAPRIEPGIVTAPAQMRQVGDGQYWPVNLADRELAPWRAAGGQPGWIDPRGAFALRFPVFADFARLPEIPVPFGLDLRKSQMGDAGMKHLARFRTLRALNLAQNQLSDVGVAELVGLSNLEQLALAENPAVTDAAMPVVGHLRALNHLDLRGTKITDAGLKQLAGLAKLSVVYLHYTGISDEGLKDVARWKNLEVLDLSRSGISDKGFAYLAGLDRLRVLHLVRTRVTDAGLKDLGRLPNLEELTLVTRRVTDAGLRDLAPLGKLKLLDLRGCVVTDAGVKSLLALSRLESLCLAGTRVTDAGLKDLAGLRNLKLLDVTSTPITQQALRQFQLERKDCTVLHKDIEHNDKGTVGSVRTLDLDLGTLTVTLPDKEAKTFPLAQDVAVSDFRGRKLTLNDVRPTHTAALDVDSFGDVVALRLLEERTFPAPNMPALHWLRVP